jgi:hypothetical protein
MDHKSAVNVSKVKDRLDNLYNQLDYIKEYGHVSCFELAPEQITAKSEQVIQLLDRCYDIIDEINESIKDSYEH